MTRDCQLCIVGGGPAGLFAGLLFARAGVETLVIEKHGDFLRDFRGDTVHPSTLDLFAQLGLLITPLLKGKSALKRAPWPLRLLNYFPLLRRIPARIIGLGFGREKIESPDAGGRRG